MNDIQNENLIIVLYENEFFRLKIITNEKCNEENSCNFCDLKKVCKYKKKRVIQGIDIGELCARSWENHNPGINIAFKKMEK